MNCMEDRCCILFLGEGITFLQLAQNPDFGTKGFADVVGFGLCLRYIKH